MKKKFTFLIAALALLTFITSPLGMRGQEVTLDFTTNSWNLPEGSTNGATQSASFTDNGITITLEATTKYYFHTDGYLLLGKANSTLTLPAFSFDVDKIEVVGRSGASGAVVQNIYVGTTAVSSATTGAQGTNTYNIATDYQAAGNIYVLTVTSAHNTQVTGINIYKKSSGSSTTYTVTYDGNGNDAGDVPTDSNSPYNSGATVTVLGNTGALEKTGYTWAGWCMDSGCTGTVYGPDYTPSFTIAENTTLYAKWDANSSSGNQETTYTFNTKSWGATPANWTSGKDGNQFTSGRGVQVTSGASGANATSPKSFTNISSIVVTYSTNASKGTGAIKVQVGSNAEKSFSVTPVGTDDHTTAFSFGPYETGSVKLTVDCSENSIYIKSITITETAGGSTSLDPSDLTITNASTDLTFDLYNNATAQVINYTTSSTGAITITPASPTTYFSYVHDATNKTITITPLAVTPSAQTVTISQEADDDYYAGTATFTVSVANSAPLANIAALTANTAAGDYVVTLTNAVVTYVNGSNAYIQDESGAVAMHKSDHGLTAGDVFNGTATVAYQLYNGNPQITNLTGVTPVSGTAPDPTEVAQSAWSYTFSNVLSQYFKVTGATITQNGTKYYVSLGGENIQIYKPGTAISSLDLTKTYTITGFPTLYNTTKELTVYTDPVVEVGTTPTINASNVTIDYDATSGEIAYTIDNPTGATLNAECTESWISDINVTSTAVTFTTTQNDGDADRTATFTLTYTGAEAKTVTVTQGHFVVDYATLPFNWAGGSSADLKALSGVTTSTLSNDYAASNAPYLVKFDDDGKYIQVKTDSQPAKVTIGVKMIGGGSTSYITVKASADGVTFDDGDSLQISGAQNSILTLNTTRTFNADVRYVKMVFTKGSNVGVGPITITKFTTDPVINADDVNLAYDATSGEIPYTITNPASGVTLQAATTASWISNIVVTDEKVSFTTTANDDTDDRVATVTLSYTGAADKTVTVTQAHQVLDYATLPFTYTDEYVAEHGLDDMPTGLTQNGLGVYTGSTPRIKFDTQGDYLILKLNATPVSVSYDIKGNSFSGGTFDVEVSADGSTYANLASYSTLTATTQTFTQVNIADDIRYIKWVYTTRSSGNVALGNIHATENYDIYGTATVDHLNIPIDKVCTIYSGATLNIGINGLSNEGNAANLIIKDGGQLKTPNEVYATVEKTITGYGLDNAQTNKGYYLVSAPAAKYLYVDKNNKDVDAFRFDAFQQGEEWQNFKTATGAWHVSASTAVLYASKNDCTLSLDGYGIVYNTQGGQPVNNKVPATDDNINVPVQFNSGKAFEGWNLIGNPYTCKAYLAGNRTFYRMNDNRDGFITGTGAIDVCEGVFVETTSGELEVAFTTTAPVTNAGNNSMINISLNQMVNRGEQTLVDNALIRFGEGNTMHKFSFSDNTAKVYIPQNGKDFAVVNADAQGEMPVNFKAAKTGTYTISVETENLDVTYLHLIDNLTGMDVDLLQTPSYTFEGKKSDYASRFRLVFSTNSTNENDSDNFAFISNGQLILTNVDNDATIQVIDALGRMVASTNANNRVYTENMAPGLYVLRLINGNDVKTQKIVVR